MWLITKNGCFGYILLFLYFHVYKLLLGIAISTIAAFVCVLSVPFVYNYVTHIQSLLQNEADFCKVHTFY